MPATI